MYERKRVLPHRRRNFSSRSEVRGIDVRSAGVATAKNGGNGNRRADLLGEASTGTTSTSTGVSDLFESGIGSVGRAGGPLRPSGSVDDGRKRGILDSDAGIGTPWTTEVVSTSLDSVARSCGDVALVEDIPAWVTRGRTAVGGHVAEAGGEDADVACAEPGGGVLAEDEVGCTLDQGLGVELVAGLGEDGVLETLELTGVVALVLEDVSLWSVPCGFVVDLHQRKLREQWPEIPDRSC